MDGREIPVDEPPEPSPLLRSCDIAHWEQRHDLTRALAELPLRQRQIMAWTLFDYTPAEIAAELRMAPDTVRQHLYLARRALSTRLTRKDGEQ